MPYNKVEKIFCAEIFCNLWQIDTLDLFIQHVKFQCRMLPCCRETLPESFENSVKGDPRKIFRSCQNLNCFQNHLILWQISCTFHFWKLFWAAAHGFITTHHLTQATFWSEKTCHTAGSKNIFRVKIFWNLWQIDTLNLLIQHVKVHPPTLPWCRGTLPESFENSAKEGPQGIFLLGSKFKFLPKPSHLMVNFLYVSLLKTVLCCCARFYHNASFNTGHFLF